MPIAETRDGRADWRLVACLVAFPALGFALRAVVAIRWPSVHRPDEVFQNLEPAHRLLTGYGIVTWEWREGIRSWLFPDVLYGIMRAIAALHLPQELAAPVIAVILSLFATATVALGVWVGWRQAGLAGAVLCGLFCAFWPDLVYFAPKPLLEVQGGNVLVIAAVLAAQTGARAPLPRWRMLAIGLLLGIVFDLRFQLIAALLVIAVASARMDWRRWAWLVLGALGPVALLGVVDAVTWGSPFQSVWKNIQINVFQGKAEAYGAEPLGWYVLALAQQTGAALIPLVFLFWFGARRAPLLAVVTVVVIGFHSLIAHKEISFIYAALPPAMIVAGLGAARLLESIQTQWRAPPRRSAALWSAAGLGAAAMLLLALAAPSYELPNQVGLRSAWADLRARSGGDLCGAALYGPRMQWWRSPGYSGLNRSLPLYLVHEADDLPSARPAFNYAVATLVDAPDLTGFTVIRCTQGICLLRRPGLCTPVPEYEINAVLVRDGN